MPPKFKFTKQQIIDTGIEMVRTAGIESITARSMAETLQSSSRVLFSHFDNMDELLKAIKDEAKQIYNARIEMVLKHEEAFRAVGTAYIVFAIQEPKLFQLLFMNELENQPSIKLVLPIITEHYQSILASIVTKYEVSETVAERLYQHMWIYCHGIATLYATKTAFFSPEEMSEMVTEIFLGLLRKVKQDD